MKPFTLSLHSVLSLLADRRQIQRADIKLVATRIQTALRDEVSQGTKYTLDSVVAACAAAGMTLTDDEKRALAALDADIAMRDEVMAAAKAARDEVLGVTPDMKAAATAAAAEMKAAEAAAKPADGVSRVPAGMGGKNV